MSTVTPMSPADVAAHRAASYVRPQAADDHDRTKEPLPPRPRGPHPYLVGAAA